MAVVEEAVVPAKKAHRSNDALPLELHDVQDPAAKAALEVAFREIRGLREEVEVLKESKVEGEDWDHTYKGDQYHIWLRENVLRLAEKGPVAYRDIRNDPVLQKSHIIKPVQWAREVDQWLVPGIPRPPGDTSALVRFEVPHGRWGRMFVTKQEYLHCHIEVAVRKTMAKAPPGETLDQAARRLAAMEALQKQWGAQDPDKCMCPEHRAMRGP